MGSLSAEWNGNQARLREIVKQEDRFGEAIELCLSMHALAHGSLTDDEIVALSRSLDKDELKKYRKDVGERTAEILRGLGPADMRRKFPPERVRRILDEGGLTEHPDSIWLLDFWGKKDVAGIILMPFTRHQLGHLNDSLRLRSRILRSAYLPLHVSRL